MGKLVVRTIQILRNETRQRPQLFEIAGSKGDSWKYRSLDFTPLKSAKVNQTLL